MFIEPIAVRNPFRVSDKSLTRNFRDVLRVL